MVQPEGNTVATAPAACRDAVVASGVWFAWREGQWVLEDVNLSLPCGTFLGITGPNGGGKTTLLRLMLGELKPTRGQIHVFGQPAHRLGRRRAQIGYLPQRLTIDPSFPATVLEVTIMGLFGRLGLGRRVPRWARERALEVLEKVGMAEHASSPIAKLSGGQQQRVLIARAIVGEPRLLLFDEPTIGVDTGGQEALFELLARLKEEMGLTIVLVTHDLLQIRHYADQLACLNRTIHWHARADRVSAEEIRGALACELRDYLAMDKRLRAASEAAGPACQVGEDTGRADSAGEER